MRLSVAAVAWIAIGAAGFFLFRSEQQIAQLRSASRIFDQHAREASDAIADLRVAQEAYVAEGQGVTFWMPKVASTMDVVAEAVRSLRQTATSAAARSALDDAAASITEFGSIDGRARDYIKSDQQLMAGDVIFTEGGETAAAAARAVESARVTERAAADSSEAGVRRQEALALGAVAALAALLILILGVAGSAPASAEPAEIVSLNVDTRPTHEVVRSGASGTQAISPVLRNAAQLCTDFGRVRDVSDLQMLLGRAAEMIDAKGLVVWVGDSAGGDLRPALAHGYSTQALARMPSVPRSADNAAAAAYRTGDLQIVMSRPGAANGAIVAPILSIDGCVGALSAEIAGGGETSESVQAIAALLAAQLSSILAAAPPATHAAAPRAVATS